MTYTETAPEDGEVEASAEPTPKFTPEVLKQAAENRRQTAIVKRYFETLEGRPRVRRRRTVGREQLQARLDEVRKDLIEASGLEKVRLVQERIDLEQRLEGSPEVASGDLEEEFVKVAGEWATRKGYSYAALREAGVPADVLRRAGISR